MSTGAETCPKCGVKRPTGQTGGQKVQGAFALLMMLDVGWCTVGGMVNAGSQVEAGNASGFLDHSKPWFTRKGLMCSTKEDLDILRENAVMQQSSSLKERKFAACWGVPDGDAVVEVDHDGVLQPDYLVRLPKGHLAWTSSIWLRN
jgi:hypothetical protein